MQTIRHASIAVIAVIAICRRIRTQGTDAKGTTDAYAVQGCEI